MTSCTYTIKANRQSTHSQQRNHRDSQEIRATKMKILEKANKNNNSNLNIMAVELFTK